jgi:hypothetical protein
MAFIFGGISRYRIIKCLLKKLGDISNNVLTLTYYVYNKGKRSSKNSGLRSVAR